MEDGTPFGRYRLLNLLGRGGMGEVWRAFDTVTERVVALKVLPLEYANDAMYQERFRREAKSAAGLDEPHVVPIHDFGEVDGRLFVTMRLIQGRDLQSILRDGRIAPTRAVAIIDQVASALHAAHRVNLVHRDVKPSNILVTDDDFAYLIDFGIARAAGQAGLTGTSNVIGTWAYMAPERISAGQADARADIYALACVLYECLTGRQPFGGDSLEQQIGGHLNSPAPRASDRHFDVPAQLDAVIARGMAKNPDDRFTTTREMATAAKCAVTGPNPVPPTPTPTPAPPPPNPYPNWQPQHGDGTSRFIPPPGGAPDADPTQYRPMPPPPAPQAPNWQEPRPSRKGRLVALSSLGVLAVVAAVVGAFALSKSDDHGGPSPGASRTPPSAPPNTGPLTGTFTAALGPQTSSNGAPATGSNAAGYSETWHLRSDCGTNGCVATATTGGQYPVKDMTFDKVGDRWLAVTTSHSACGKREDAEVFTVVTLQLQADGTVSGEATRSYEGECFNKRTVALNRTGDTDVSALPDPATLPKRVVSRAEALHGAYEEQLNYSNGSKFHYSKGVRTDCLRTGDRCMSLFVALGGKGANLAFIFGNGTWTHTSEFDGDCPRGGTSHVTLNETAPLPDPPQDPIRVLIGHGYQNETGACISSSFDDTFTRTGD
jgi:serine/threonine protein kinase